MFNLEETGLGEIVMGETVIPGSDLSEQSTVKELQKYVDLLSGIIIFNNLLTRMNNQNGTWFFIFNLMETSVETALCFIEKWYRFADYTKEHDFVMVLWKLFPHFTHLLSDFLVCVSVCVF